MKTKILISYHDEHYRIKSDILNPIQTGCATAPRLFAGMLRDNTGDNISAANSRYCELSAQYWVGTHLADLGNPDYIGFMHYRRHFIFDNWTGNPDWCWLPKSRVYFVPNITKQYLAHISDENIQNTLKDCDCVVLKPYDVRHIDSKNIREQFSKLPEQDVNIFDVFIETAKKLHPEYLADIEKIENGSMQYLCNMFVMKKDLFLEYNDFCFSILKEVDAQINSSAMNTQASRFLGYLGEFCLSIFIFRLKRENNLRIKELDGSFILYDKKFAHPTRKFLYYWLMSKITFGSMRKHYKRKRKELKMLIKNF